MTVPQSTVYFTAKDGSEAQISGDVGAIDALETILKNAGVTYNQQVGCVMDVHLDEHELGYLIRALAMAASRLEAQAAWNPRGKNARDHDYSAAQMRKLRTRLTRCRLNVEAVT